MREPATAGFVMALIVPEDRGPGLWTTIECTHPADRSVIIESILVDGTDLDVLDDVADTLVEKLIGWKRWEATFVWRKTIEAWPIVDGDLASRGVDITAIPPARATNTAYSWWRQNLGRDEQAWKKFTRDMTREPRRILEREASKPMDPAVFGQLQALTARKPKPATAVPESTITMPDHVS
ncbi:hypothetical protein [Gordonia sp. SND2]|uniref:hypothetical protein n=1 Tax=Gordonia sp. SND2 TaxID=3388659 RepID=UPI00398B7D68